MPKLWSSVWFLVSCSRFSRVPHSRSQKSRMAATKSRCSSVNLKSTAGQPNRTWLSSQSAFGGLDVVDLIVNLVDQAADAVLGAVQCGRHHDEDDHGDDGEDRADDPGEAADAGQGAVAGVTAVGVSDPDRAQDDRADAAREGDEEAAGAEEDEEDREGAEEERGERGKIALVVRRRGEAARCGTAGCGGLRRGRPGRRARMPGGRGGAGWHQGGGGGSSLQ